MTKNIRAALALCAWAWTAALQAAPAVTLTDANDSTHPITYTAGPFVAPNNLPAGSCSAAAPCDDTPLTINVSAATAANKRVVVRIDWQTTVYADFDLYVLKGTNSIAASASTTDPEIARFAASNGAYTIHVVPYQPSASSFTTTIFLESVLPPAPANVGPAARYQIYPPPTTLTGINGGEPSIGTSWKTGSTVVGNSSAALFVNWDDGGSPAYNIWANRPPRTNAVSFDPILYTDRATGRTITSQLVSDVTVFAAGCSLSSVSDDDGATWIPAEGCGPPAGADHQGMGGGPYTASPPPGAGVVYANAVYYCAQSAGGVIGDATCSRSDDGGLTYGPGILVYTTQCGGLHGHPRVAPDGTVFLPNKGCTGATGLNQGGVISKDNGLTWTVTTIPGSITGESDPSVAMGLNNTGKPAGQTSNTFYFGYCDGDGHAKVATSANQGTTWKLAGDVGAAAGIQNCVFPEMIAGDDNRAALYFLGTPTPGDSQDAAFPGEWHAYVATTYDGGATWGLSDTTPNDPVQIGCVWQQGGSNPCRNMLDFNDIAIDKQGRPNYVFADGCLAPACAPGAASSTSRSTRNTIGRQSGGKTLFSAFDCSIGLRMIPSAPQLVSASRDATGVSLSWLAPDNGGSALTAYNIYRGTAAGQEVLLSASAPGKPLFLDATVASGTAYFYKVTAVNANGESTSYRELQVPASGAAVLLAGATPPAVDYCKAIVVPAPPTPTPPVAAIPVLGPAPVVAPAPASQSQGRFGGGALGLLFMLPLLAAGTLRRKRR